MLVSVAPHKMADMYGFATDGMGEGRGEGSGGHCIVISFRVPE